MAILGKLQQGGILSRENFDPEMLFKDKYNTKLTGEEMSEYGKWVDTESRRQGRNILMDKGTYDVQGYWKNDRTTDADGHGSDRWKKPNHPKFSNESIYNGVDGYEGGTWEGDAFHPPAHSLEMYGEKGLQRYFDMEPGRPEYLDMSRHRMKKPGDRPNINYTAKQLK